MNTQIGMKTTWECPSCGCLITERQPMWRKEFRKKVIEPKGCGCGNKGTTGSNRFVLYKIEQCSYACSDDDQDNTPQVRSTPQQSQQHLGGVEV